MMKTLAVLLLTAVSSFCAQIPRPAGEFAIKMPSGSETLLSKSRGKIVVMAFIYTTCPHCQKTIPVLNQIQADYAAKGVVVMGAAFNENAGDLVPAFIAQFGPKFPLGSAERNSVLEFLQHSLVQNFYVPIMVFIDKTGQVRSQFIGDESFFADTNTHAREQLDMILAHAPAKSPVSVKSPAAAPKASVKSATPAVTASK